MEWLQLWSYSFTDSFVESRNQHSLEGNFSRPRFDSLWGAPHCKLCANFLVILITLAPTLPAKVLDSKELNLILLCTWEWFNVPLVVFRVSQEMRIFYSYNRILRLGRTAGARTRQFLGHRRQFVSSSCRLAAGQWFLNRWLNRGRTRW